MFLSWFSQWYNYKYLVMEYNINNPDLISNVEDRNFLDRHLKRFINKMGIIPKKYTKSDTINIHLEELDDKLSMEVSLNLNTGHIFMSQQGVDIKSIVPKVFYLFSRRIAEEIETIRRKFLHEKRNLFLETVSLDREDLRNLDEKGRGELFKSLIPMFLPALKGYITRRVDAAKRADLKALSNVDVKDVVNEVVVRVHASFLANVEDVRFINIWMIREADAILNSILDNYVSDDVSFEELVDKELGLLEEEYTVDAGGDLVMKEELDEYDMDFGVEDIILSSKGENEFIDSLDISKTKLKDKICDELVKLPLRYQSIYDLYFFEHMDYDEIASIKNMKEMEVEAIIVSIKELLKEKLFD